MNDDTNRLLEEQTRLLRKADRRGGCIWNLIMLVFFGVFYVAWLILKRLVKWTIAALRLAWHCLRWLGRLIARTFRRNATGDLS